MIERQFVSQKIKEFKIEEYISKVLSKAGYSHTEIHRTPLGEKVTVYTTRPGLVVGRKGDNIKKLTQVLKKKFKLENPQIEIGEVQNPMLDVHYVAEKIAYNIERYGLNRFKSIGYRTLQDVMDAGAVGVEILISGKVPSSRAKSWRFAAGYLKKSGEIALSKIHRSTVAVNLKSGTLGIKVNIMTPDIELPDKLKLGKIELDKVEKQIQETAKKTQETESQSSEEEKEDTKTKTKEKEKEEAKEKKSKRSTKIKTKETKE